MYGNIQMEFESDKNEDENLLSGITQQTPSKDDVDMYYTQSFQVSPSFQQSQQKKQETNTFKADFMTSNPFVEQQHKNYDLSFSLNNQSIKQDNCYFQQIFENLAKLEMDLNNQSLHESYSEVKSTILELQDKYMNYINFNTSDQVTEFQNQYLPQSSGSKHMRTRSEATPSINNFICKPKKIEQPNIEKSFDTNIFQKQSEEYSLLLDIIKQDIQNIENTEFKEYDQGMELIICYYELRDIYQQQLIDKDQLIENLQNYHAQYNFNIQEYHQHFDTLAQNCNLNIKKIQDVSKDELVSLIIEKIQELNQENKQLTESFSFSKQNCEKLQEELKLSLEKSENMQNTNTKLIEQIQQLSIVNQNQDQIIRELNQQIIQLKQNFQDDQFTLLFQNFGQLMKQVLDFSILSNKLLQHIYNQTGANLQTPDYKHLCELQTNIQCQLQSWDIINFKKISENLIAYQSEIENQKNEICLQYQNLVQQIIKQRQQLMEQLQI